MLNQLFESHLDVSDLARSMWFYEEVLGLELGLKDETRRIAFYWIGGRMKTMLGLWEKKDTPIVSRHLAFEVDFAELGPAIDRLATLGVVTKDFAGAPTRAPFVFAWMPAAAIYFNDPDEHLLELVARVPGAPRAELGIVGLADWLERNV